jgi:hypothetical protein
LYPPHAHLARCTRSVGDAALACEVDLHSRPYADNGENDETRKLVRARKRTGKMTRRRRRTKVRKVMRMVGMTDMVRF